MQHLFGILYYLLLKKVHNNHRVNVKSAAFKKCAKELHRNVQTSLIFQFTYRKYLLPCPEAPLFTPAEDAFISSKVAVLNFEKREIII